MKERIQALKVKLAIFFAGLAEWISPKVVSKESITAEAKRIYPYVIILWSDDEMWTQAFRLLKDRGLVKPKELSRLVQKAELQRKSKFLKQVEFVDEAKKILKEQHGKNRKPEI